MQYLLVPWPRIVTLSSAHILLDKSSLSQDQIQYQFGVEIQPSLVRGSAKSSGRGHPQLPPLVWWEGQEAVSGQNGGIGNKNAIPLS